MTIRLTLRSLAAHKLRLGLTMLAVVLGVAFVAGTLILSATTSSAFDSLYAKSGKGVDTVVRTVSSSDGETAAADTAVPGSLLTTIGGVSGVAKAQGVSSGFAGIVDKKGSVIGGEGTPQNGIGWTDDADFSPLHLTSGRGPRAPNEIAIDSITAKKAGYQEGDQVKVVLRGPSQTFTLVGTFTLGDTNSAGGTTITAFEPATAQQVLMEKPGTYSQIQVHAQSGVSQQQLRSAVAKVLPGGLEAITGKQANDEAAASVNSIISLLNTFLLVFAAVSVFVSSFIIFNTFTILVAQRTRELALLRAVGASRTQVTRLVLGEATGVGFIGSTIGLGLGALLVVGLRALFKAAGLDLPPGGLVFSTVAVVSAYAVGMTVTLFAAYFPGRRAARIPPVAAMRHEVALPLRSLRNRVVLGCVATAAGIGALAGGLTGHGTTALYLTGAGALVIFLGITTLSPIVSKPVIAALGWPFARLFGTVGRLSRENAQRNPRRTAATASALMIGLALVGTVTVLASSITASIDAQFASGLGADYLIYAKGGSSFSPETVDAVTKVPGVRNAVPVRTTKLTLDSKKVTVTVGQGPDLVSAYALDVKDGSSTLGADEVLVTQGTAEGNGWKVGGTVPGTYADGSTAKFRIAGLYADSITGPAIILGTAGYLAHSTSRLINEIDVLANPGVNIAATKQAIQSALSSWPNLSLLDQSDIKNRAKTGVNTLLTLILVMLVLSVVIAALGVVNTLALSVIERTREIGLLRAVGMDRRNLRRMIRYEAVMIAVFGAVLGLGTGVIFGWAFQRAEAGKGLHVLAIPVGRLGLYVLAAVVIGVIAAIWPARRAAKMDILRAISTE